MLKFLHIENIAVIEKCDIEFQKGLNVLTGETGAGKSIVIDSINAVLGQRTSKDLIRTGCDTALVSVIFGDLDSNVKERLKEYDFLPDDEGNITITRKLSIQNNGYIKVNGKPSSLNIIKEISEYLINIHGQHDNQALLNPDKHCSFIDSMADNYYLIDEYYKEFKNLNNIRKEIQSLQMDQDEKIRKTELLKYQISELERTNFKIGEIESLKEKLSIAENIEATLKTYSYINSIFSGDENTEGILSLISSASKKLQNLNNKETEELLQLLDDIKFSSLDLNSKVNSFLLNDEYSQLNTDKINERLDELTRVMIKYGNSESDCIDYKENAEKQLENIILSDKKIIELEDLLEASKLKLIDLAQNVTKSRIDTAKKFEKNVCEILEFLNMPDVSFKVNIEKGKYTKSGCDVIEFLISANAGEELKPLFKTASGGELSRIMLAIKSCLAEKDNIGSMIFDEIDSGISGYAADKVGIQLKKFSCDKQIICITHLAQIAARADEHLLITKHTEDNRTFTLVNSLDNENRIREIARIMSGKELTENIYNSAKELIDRSNKNENL